MFSLSYVLRYEDHFRRKLQEKLQLEGEEKLRAQRQQLAKAQKRIADIDRLFIRIYEDNVCGKLSDDKFSMMSQAYEAEQEHLEEEVAQPGRTDTKRNSVTEVTLSSENMKLSYFQKILFYELRSKPRGVFYDAISLHNLFCNTL